MSKTREFIFLPALAWLLAIIGTYVFLGPYYVNNFTTDKWVFFTIFLVVERLIAAIAITEICKQQGLNVDRWFLASLFFGINILLFVNIWIWFKPSK